VLRLLMPIAVVGKEKPVKVYEVMGLAREFDATTVDFMELEDEKHGTVSDADMTSDTMTLRQESRYSSTEGSHGRRRRMRKAVKHTIVMVRDAAVKTTSEVPLTCTVDETLFAKQASKAVHLYIDGRFADAISALDALESMVPAYLYDGDSKATPEGPQGAPSGTNGDGNDNAPLVRCAGAARRSLDLVRGLCEKYLREGTPADFDGVYRALEK